MAGENVGKHEEANTTSALISSDPKILARPDVTSLLPTIRVPSLVVVGEEDLFSPPEEMAAIAAAIPGAELVIVPNAGHMAMMENPAAVSDALLRFLEAAGD